MKDQDRLIEQIMNHNNTNISADDLKKAASGDLQSVMSKMKKEDSEKLKALLADPQKTKELLSSDAATKLMNALFGKGKNG